eukprot:GHVO01069704.1.p2 GENE.GHVO01069704.1~~GHVO01069704.1.p2  ORF type:complete len:111 (+),score=10.26 GHVO01069704.1:537-869(+)
MQQVEVMMDIVGRSRQDDWTTTGGLIARALDGMHGMVSLRLTITFRTAATTKTRQHLEDERGPTDVAATMGEQDKQKKEESFDGRTTILTFILYSIEVAIGSGCNELLLR